MPCPCGTAAGLRRFGMIGGWLRHGELVGLGGRQAQPEKRFSVKGYAGLTFLYLHPSDWRAPFVMLPGRRSNCMREVRYSGRFRPTRSAASGDLVPDGVPVGPQRGEIQVSGSGHMRCSMRQSGSRFGRLFPALATCACNTTASLTCTDVVTARLSSAPDETEQDVDRDVPEELMHVPPAVAGTGLPAAGRCPAHAAVVQAEGHELPEIEAITTITSVLSAGCVRARLRLAQLIAEMSREAVVVISEANDELPGYFFHCGDTGRSVMSQNRSGARLSAVPQPPPLRARMGCTRTAERPAHSRDTRGCRRVGRWLLRSGTGTDRNSGAATDRGGLRGAAAAAILIIHFGEKQVRQSRPRRWCRRQHPAPARCRCRVRSRCSK